MVQGPAAPDQEKSMYQRVPPNAGGGESGAKGLLAALAVMLVVTVIKLQFRVTLGDPTPFLLYFTAIMAGAWYGGARVGFLVTALSGMVGQYFFLKPAYSFQLTDAAQVQFAVFLFEGGVISVITARLRSGQHKARLHLDAAQVSTRRLTALLESSRGAITVQSPDGRLTYANAAAAELIGYPSVEALLAAPLADLAAGFQLRDSDHQPIPADALPSRIALKTGQPVEKVVCFNVVGSTTERWSVVSSAPVRGLDGQTDAVINVFYDVTEMRQLRQSLQTSQAWFSTALRSIGDAVIAADVAGRVTFMNPVAEELTGKSSKDSVGKMLREVFPIVHEHTRDTAENPVERVLREGVVVGMANHTVLLRPDGTEVPIDDSAAPIRDAAGLMVGVILVFRDVSVRRREEQRRNFLAGATQELSRSVDYQSTLSTIARLAVPTFADWATVDILEDGVIRRLALTHVDPAKLDFVAQLQARYPPEPNPDRGMHHVLKTGLPEMMEHIPASVIAASARDDEHLKLLEQLVLRSYVSVPLKVRGSVIGVLSFVMAESNRNYTAQDMDVAVALADRASVAVENAQLFDAAQSALQQARDASRTKDDFLAMLGHELRNPLAPILTALRVMKLRTSEVSAERTTIERQVHHMVRLVDDLLDVSRIAQGKVALKCRPIPLADAVKDAIDTSAPLLEERGHHLTVDVSAGLLVNGDRVRLVQVIGNLLNNAAKYTEPGGRVSVCAQRTGPVVSIQVTDTGMGIPEDMLGRVFEPFIQKSQALDRARGGLGLGLAVVKNLVQLHGGQVSARSGGPGKGTTFEVQLPAVEVPSADTQPSTAQPASTALRGAGLRVLVVDDNADAAEMLAVLLGLTGFTVETAHDGPEALKAAATFRPQLALLDIGLPVMDGYEVGSRLRAHEGLSDLKLIALTGYGQSSDRERSLAAGFDAHIVKPVDPDDLLQVIASLAPAAA